MTKMDVAVAHAPMEGFDLIALDRKGKALSKGKLVGISVKTRLLTGNNYSAHTLSTGVENASKAAKIWRAEPWLAIVCGSIGYSLEVFLLPYSKCEMFAGRTTTSNRISVTSLRDDKTGVVKKPLSELRFIPPQWLSISDMEDRLKKPS